jgi:hypothetical protein
MPFEVEAWRPVMNKSHKLLLAGAMTPGFALAGGAAEARFVEPIANGQLQNTHLGSERDKAALKAALLALSPAEKLRSAGDRIRLARKQTGGTPSTSKPGGQKTPFKAPPGAWFKPKHKVPQPPKRNTGLTCNFNDCSGMLFAWS